MPGGVVLARFPGGEGLLPKAADLTRSDGPDSGREARFEKAGSVRADRPGLSKRS